MPQWSIHGNIVSESSCTIISSLSIRQYIISLFRVFLSFLHEQREDLISIDSFCRCYLLHVPTVPGVVVSQGLGACEQLCSQLRQQAACFCAITHNRGWTTVATRILFFRSAHVTTVGIFGHNLISCVSPFAMMITSLSRTCGSTTSLLCCREAHLIRWSTGDAANYMALYCAGLKISLCLMDLKALVIF